MRTFLLQFKTYRVKLRTEPHNRINTRELNRVLVTKCLSYIHFATGLCYTNKAYPKGTCVLHVINMWDNIIIPESSTMFFVICNYMTITCDITLNPNSKFEKKWKRK